MCSDLKILRAELAEAERALASARLARASIDEADAGVVARAEEAVRLARRNRDQAEDRLVCGAALARSAAVVADHRAGSARALRIAGNGRELIRMKLALGDRTVSLDLTTGQAGELVSVLRKALAGPAGAAVKPSGPFALDDAGGGP